MRRAWPDVPEVTEAEVLAGHWAGDRLIVAEVTLERIDYDGKVRSLEVLDEDEGEAVAVSDACSTDFPIEEQIGPGKKYRRLPTPRYEVWCCDHESPHRSEPILCEHGLRPKDCLVCMPLEWLQHIVGDDRHGGNE